MAVQDRIKNNIEYFKGLDIQGGLYILKVQYKPKWSAYPSKDGLIKVAKSDTIADEYFYYGKIEEVDIEVMFDLIETTISMNLEANMKIQLMLEKIEELKRFFGEYSLEKLQTLRFVFDEPQKKDNKKRKYTKKKKEEKPLVTLSLNENIEEQVEELPTVEEIKEEEVIIV